jgi:HEAT repeat protein
MMLPSRANDIPQLVRGLGSRSRSRVDAARARLSIIGARAVDSLVEALEGDNNTVRLRAMQLLALIQDPRGRGPLIAMLLDRNARLRTIAARCLGRFPAAESVAALDRLLEHERGEPVRIAAVQSLVDQYAGGQEQAIRRVLDVLTDARQARRVRLAACALVPLLNPAERNSVTRRLAEDRDEKIQRKVAGLEADPVPERVRTLQQLAVDLASEDYEVWNEAIHRLSASGAAAVAPLLAEMQSRSHDPEFCARAGMVLKSLGPRRGHALADALDELEEPIPLQVLVEVIGALGEKSMIYRLKELIERVWRQPCKTAEANGFDPMQRVRAKAHLELARIGSRVAIRDLRDALSDPEQRLDPDMLLAIELIGKRDELLILLRAHQREDRFMRERIAGAVRLIMRRERIRRDSRIFRALAPDLRRTLESILPPPRRAVRREASGP